MQFKWKARIVALIEIVFSLTFVLIAVGVVFLALACSTQLYLRKLEDLDLFAITNGTFGNHSTIPRFCKLYRIAVTVYDGFVLQTISLGIMALLFVLVLMGPLWVNVKLIQTVFSEGVKLEEAENGITIWRQYSITYLIFVGAILFHQGLMIHLVGFVFVRGSFLYIVGKLVKMRTPEIQGHHEGQQSSMNNNEKSCPASNPVDGIDDRVITCVKFLNVIRI